MMQLFSFEVQSMPSYWTWLMLLLFAHIHRANFFTKKILVKLLDFAKS